MYLRYEKAHLSPPVPTRQVMPRPSPVMAAVRMACRRYHAGSHDLQGRRLARSRPSANTPLDRSIAPRQPRQTQQGET